MRRVCGNSARTLPPWVGATARRQRGYWVGRVGGRFAAESKTERRGGARRRPGRSGILREKMTKSRMTNDERAVAHFVIRHSSFVIRAFMLLWLLHHLIGFRPNRSGGWAKITPRAALAAGLSFAVAVLLGPRWIGWLRRRFREPIKSDSPEIVRLHGDKQSTPTMGGLFVVAALVASVLLFGDLATAMWRRRCSWPSDWRWWASSMIW